MKTLFVKQAKQLTMRNTRYRSFLLDYAQQMLADDIGSGDITTALLGRQAGQIITARITAKQAGVIAGMDEAKAIWQNYGIRASKLAKDGARVRRGEVIAELRGPAGSVLTTERTVLNLLQRMSGIATATAELVKKVGAGRIAATRKTPLGLLDCRAVMLGGGLSHRLDLADQILVKDNHLAISPDCWRDISPDQPFAIEADTARFACIVALHFGKTKNLTILLDNFTPAQLKKLVPELRTLNPHITLEASGGITEKTAASYLKTGVDYISLGWLTHSSRALDLSLTVTK